MSEPITVALRESITFIQFSTAKVRLIFGNTKNRGQILPPTTDMMEMTREGVTTSIQRIR